MLFMPDSPVRLLTKGDDEGARKSLEWLRGSECTYIDEELESIKKNIQDAEGGDESASLKDLFTKAVYLKPFGIGLGLMFFQQFCGINAVLFYLQQIFQAVHSDMDTGLQAFLIGVTQVKRNPWQQTL